jgi:hypothetical protein
MLVAFGVLWFLYDHQIAVGPWLVAALLVGHGAVHGLFLVGRPAATASGPEWPFDLAGSWSISAGLDLGVARTVAVGLIALVIAGFSLSGLATVGLVLPHTWWPALVSASAGLSLVLLILFFDAQLLVGVMLDLILLWLAIASTWRPTIA